MRLFGHHRCVPGGVYRKNGIGGLRKSLDILLGCSADDELIGILCLCRSDCRDGSEIRSRDNYRAVARIGGNIVDALIEIENARSADARVGIDNMLDIGVFARKLSRTLIFLGVLRQGRCDYGDLFAGRFASGSARARAHTYGDCQDEQECCRGFECLFHMIHLIFP